MNIEFKNDLIRLLEIHNTPTTTIAAVEAFLGERVKYLAFGVSFTPEEVKNFPGDIREMLKMKRRVGIKTMLEIIEDDMEPEDVTDPHDPYQTKKYHYFLGYVR